MSLGKEATLSRFVYGMGSEIGGQLESCCPFVFPIYRNILSLQNIVDCTKFLLFPNGPLTTEQGQAVRLPAFHAEYF